MNVFARRVFEPEYRFLAEDASSFAARSPGITPLALWPMQDSATEAVDLIGAQNLTASGAVTFLEKGDFRRSAIRLTTGGRLDLGNNTFLDADLAADFSVWGRMRFDAVPSNSRAIFGKRNTVGWSLRALTVTGHLELTLDPGGAGTITLEIEEDFFTDAPWFEVMVTYSRTEQMAYLMAIREGDDRAFIVSSPIDGVGSCTSTARFGVGLIAGVNDTENLVIEYLEAGAALQPRDFYGLSVRNRLPNLPFDVFSEDTWDRNEALSLCTDGRGFEVLGEGNFALGDQTMDTQGQQVRCHPRANFFFAGTGSAVILSDSSAWDGGRFKAIGPADNVATCFEHNVGGELRNVRTENFARHVFLENGQNAYLHNVFGIGGGIGLSQNGANPQNSIRMLFFGFNNMTSGIILERCTQATFAFCNIEHMTDVGIGLYANDNLSIRNVTFSNCRLETCHEVSPGVGNGTGRGDIEVIGQLNGGAGGARWNVNQNQFIECEVSNSFGERRLWVEEQAENKIHVHRGNLETNRGWIRFTDTQYGPGTPFTIPANTRTVLPNNGFVTDETFAPTDSLLWLANDAFVPPKTGDVFAWRLEFSVNPTLNNRRLTIELDDGAVIHSTELFLNKGAGTPHPIHETATLNIPDSSSPISIYVTCDGEIDVDGMTWTLHRIWKK